MTEILDERAVSEIEARANAATEKPWANLRDYTPPAIWSRGPTCRFEIPHSDADREFIAHAREDIPALCATVKTLRTSFEISEANRTDDAKCHREIRRDLQSQLEQLRGWKESAMTLLARYDSIAESFGGKLGSSKIDNLERGVEQLRAAEHERTIAVRFLVKQGYARCAEVGHGCDGWHPKL